MTRPGAVELFVDRRDCPVKVGRIKLHSVKERLVGSLAERGKVGRVLLNAVYKTGIGCIGIFWYSERHRRQDLFGKTLPSLYERFRTVQITRPSRLTRPSRKTGIAWLVRAFAGSAQERGSGSRIQRRQDYVLLDLAWRLQK